MNDTNRPPPVEYSFEEQSARMEGAKAYLKGALQILKDMRTYEYFNGSVPSVASELEECMEQAQSTLTKAEDFCSGLLPAGEMPKLSKTETLGKAIEVSVLNALVLPG
jgi:hypothetical protein